MLFLMNTRKRQKINKTRNVNQSNIHRKLINKQSNIKRKITKKKYFNNNNVRTYLYF